MMILRLPINRPTLRKAGATAAIAIMCCLIIFPPVRARESGAGFLPVTQSMQEILEQQIRILNVDGMTAVIRELDDEVRAQLPEFNLRQLIFHPETGFKFEPIHITQTLLRYLSREIALNASLLGQFIVLAVLSSLLQAVSKSFGGDQIGELAFMTGFLATCYIGVQGFRVALDIAHQTLDMMVSFMYATLPVLATLLVAAGGVTSAAVFHPVLVTAVTAIATLVLKVLFPLFFLSAVFGIVGHFSKDFPVSKLGDFTKGIAMTTMGFAFTLFAGVMSVRGAIAPVTDGVSLRAARFLTGKFVPVVGGFVADSLDLIVGGSLLIKAAVGAFGLAAIMIMTAFPLMKLVSILLIFRLACVIIQPICDARLVGALGSMANGLTLILASVLLTSLMFFVSLTVVIGVGNVTAFMR